MTHLEALDRLVDRPDHRRLAELCDGSNPDAWQRDGYRRRVIAIATGESPPARPTAVESIADLALVRACPFRSVGADGCSCGRCALRNGGKVATSQCLACIRQFGA
jgi:hypothetical protein